MPGKMRGLAVYLTVAAALLAATRAVAQSDFPYGHELLLDVSPLKGSKRVPGLTIEMDGTASIDLWCNSAKGQLVVAADTITIITGPMTERQCPADRAEGDETVLAALKEVSNWRREGDVLVLTGTTTMRFRLTTN
jgi:heat shock protein HslJ